MFLKKIVCGLALALIAASAAAQTAKEEEKTLRDSLLKKQFFLRGFNANQEIRWRWNGSALVQEPSRFHTLGVLVPTSVSIKGDTVKIEGDRHTLLRSADNSFTLSRDTPRVRVVVNLRAADAAILIPKLPGLLFYPDAESALADLPEEYRGLVPAESYSAVGNDKPRNCDCANPHAIDCPQGRLEIGFNGMKAPKVVTQVDPEIPESMRGKPLITNVQIGMIVNTSGKPDFLWISKPTDTEFDASAMRAVSQYTFKPATCHDQPVAVDLFIDVNFQVN